jgi:hypothetical protein
MVGPGPAITGPPGESMEAQSDSFIAKPAQLRSESKTNKGKQKALNKMNLIKRREQRKAQSVTKTTLYSLPKLHISSDTLFFNRPIVARFSLTRQSTRIHNSVPNPG